MKASALALALLVAATLLGLASPGSASGAAPKRPWLWQCEQIGLEQAKDACYVRMLLLDINRSGNPATELPKIDRRARATPTSLYSRCHMLMHQVGRMWAKEHHLTLEHLQDVVPRSNDPGCSAGFGMGLVMALGPQIIKTGGRSALKTCVRLPTRYRQFTCVHSLGHALMRGYHEALWLAVTSCTRLGSTYAPDCAQGAFHDYWIAMRGADDASSPLDPVRSPRKLCRQYAHYALACWYRYWIELAPGPVIQKASDLLRLCHGLAGAQRAGCIAGAGKAVFDTPVGQTRMCSRLRAAADALACLRGVATQADAGHPRAEVALFKQCSRMPKGAQAGCAAWFGKTFNVVENGHFLTSGCPKVRLHQACAAGALTWRGPLVTFS